MSTCTSVESLDLMVRIIPTLGLVLGITACRAPQPGREVGQRPETSGQSLPQEHGSPQSSLYSHVTESSFDLTNRRALSAEDASVLAAGLANEQCERQYRRRPFKPEQYPAILQEGVYHWGRLDVGGHEGFSASVSFNPDGSEPHVEVYFSTDAVLGMK